MDLKAAVAAHQPAISSLSDALRSRWSNARILPLSELKSALDPAQQRLVEWLLELKPQDVGVNLPFYGREEPTAKTRFHLVKRKLQRQLEDGRTKTWTDTQYVPLPVWKAWQKLYNELTADTGLDITIVSAYRSPAYQCLLLAYNLAKAPSPDEWPRVFKLVALPGYSEHGLIEETALDLHDPAQTAGRADELEAFADSPAYAWLLERAGDFGFTLSYPENNPEGMDFEPWHWRFRTGSENLNQKS